MYKEFYGLSQFPFNITPNAGAVVFLPFFKEALARLHYSIDSAKGLTILAGEAGTGKTTALRWMLRQMESTVLAVDIVNPCISVDEFYFHLVETLKLGDWSNKSDLLLKLRTLLEKRHRLGLRTVLVVDEAHLLSDRLLEEIRLLLNFHSDTANYLQIILAGQPELLERIDRPELRQFKQRITLSCHLRPLASVSELDTYIRERLREAGALQTEVFEPSALRFIFQCTEGIPRVVNNLCDNAMLIAYERNRWSVGRDIVVEAARCIALIGPNEVVDEEGDKTDSGIFTADGVEQLLRQLDSNWPRPTLSDLPSEFNPID